MTRQRRGSPDLPPGPASDLVRLLRRLQRSSRITGKRVAEKAGLSSGHVSDVLAGWKAPSPDAAEDIVRALRGTDDDVQVARTLADELHDLNRYYRARPALSVRTGPAEADPSPLRFRLLGPVSAHGPSGPLDLGGEINRAVLAALLFRGTEGASADDLIRLVWGSPGAASRDSVYRCVSNLRAALARVPDATLNPRRPHYELVTDPEAVDWHRFRRLLAEAQAARAGGRLDHAADGLRRALALWRGEPLGDIGGRLGGPRAAMVEQRRSAAEMLAEVEAARGQPGAVIELLWDNPLAVPERERSAVLLIEALVAMGRRDDAAAVYRRVRARLADEQGMDPGPELETAHRRALASPGPPPEAAVPATPLRPISGMPDHDPHFSGRTRELGLVVDALSGPGPRVCVIHGLGGSGKTAVAVRAAEALAADYPDGTVLLDLHGFTGTQAPLTAPDALDRLLRRLRVDGRAIPDDNDERAAFYRDHVSGRRILIILDNAHDVAQVRPLLPGSTGPGVLVTSRSRLVPVDYAKTVGLDAFTQDEAVSLFLSVAGEDRIRGGAGSDASVSNIVERCGHLPLAVRIVAGRYRVRDGQRLADLEAELSDAGDTLDGLDDDEQRVTRSLRVSVTDLPDDLARTLTLLTAVPGVDHDPYATAALAGLTLAEATRSLGALVDRNLMLMAQNGRYHAHDLVALYVRRHATGVEPVGAALHRLADYYLRAAEQADRVLTPHHYRLPITTLDRAITLPAMPDHDAALEWLTTERSNLSAVCIAAGTAGLDTVCWQLAFTLRGYFFLTKDTSPWTSTHEEALRAARRTGDVRAEAMILNSYGLARSEQGDVERAAEMYRCARELFASIDDPHGENTARANIAWLAYGDGRFDEFIAEMRVVRDFYRATGAQRNEAITIRGIGLAESSLGDTAAAVADLQSALDLFQRMGGPPVDIVMAWNGLGEAHQRGADPVAARAAFVAGLAGATRCGSLFERGRAHYRLGQIARADGDVASARAHWSAALADYATIGAAGPAAVVRAELADLRE